MIKILVFSCLFLATTVSGAALGTDSLVASATFPDLDKATAVSTTTPLLIFIKAETTNANAESLKIALAAAAFDVTDLVAADVAVAQATQASDCSAVTASDYATITAESTGGLLTGAVTVTSGTILLVGQDATDLTDKCYKLTISANLKLKEVCGADSITVTGNDAFGGAGNDLTGALTITAPVASAPCKYCTNVDGTAIGASNCQCGASSMTTGVFCPSTTAAGKKCGKSTGDLGTAASADVYTCVDAPSSGASSVVASVFALGFALLVRRSL